MCACCVRSQPIKAFFWVQYEDADVKNPYPPKEYGDKWLFILKADDDKPTETCASDSAPTLAAVLSPPPMTSPLDENEDAIMDGCDVGDNDMSPSGASQSSEF